MCGRYAILSEEKIYTIAPWVRNAKKVGEPFASLPRYNASPMQKLPVLAVRDQEIRFQPMQWWLIPHWSKDGKILGSTFNARADTLMKSKLFAPYFKSSRCLVPADAFYEWQKVKLTGEVRGKPKTVEQKQPWCIRRKDDGTLMFAGLFSVWKKPTGEEFPTFSIITTDPNSVMSPIHNRMPVILGEKDYEMWIDRSFDDTEKLLKLLKPFAATKTDAYKVSVFVSNSRNDGPECMKSLGK